MKGKINWPFPICRLGLGFIILSCEQAEELLENRRIREASEIDETCAPFLAEMKNLSDVNGGSLGNVCVEPVSGHCSVSFRKSLFFSEKTRTFTKKMKTSDKKNKTFHSKDLYLSIFSLSLSGSTGLSFSSEREGCWM
mgnify:CR=1 FL=1